MSITSLNHDDTTPTKNGKQWKSQTMETELLFVTRASVSQTTYKHSCNDNDNKLWRFQGRGPCPGPWQPTNNADNEFVSVICGQILSQIIGQNIYLYRTLRDTLRFSASNLHLPNVLSAVHKNLETSPVVLPHPTCASYSYLSSFILLVNKWSEYTPN